MGGDDYSLSKYKIKILDFSLILQEQDLDNPYLNLVVLQFIKIHSALRCCELWEEQMEIQK